MKSLEPFDKKLGIDTWHYAKRCFLNAADMCAKNMLTLKDQSVDDILQFFEVRIKKTTSFSSFHIVGLRATRPTHTRSHGGRRRRPHVWRCHKGGATRKKNDIDSHHRSRSPPLPAHLHENSRLHVIIITPPIIRNNKSLSFSLLLWFC